MSGETIRVKRRSYSESDYNNVLELREKGLSQRQISEKLNIPAGTAYLWYTGKRKPFSAWTEEELDIHTQKRRSRRHSLESIEKMRVSKLGSKNSKWKGDEAKEPAIRARLQRSMPVPKGSDRHHIDGNGLNSDPNNIRVQTRRDHMIKDGRMNRRDKKGRFKSKI